MRFLSFLLFFACTCVQAHGLEYRYGLEPALVVTLTDEDGHSFSFRDYEVFRAGEQTPYQVGRTDGQGRIAFLPDRAGAWRVRAISEDGHGIDFVLQADAADRPAGVEKPAFERYGRLAFGVALILGLFASLGLYLKRTRAR